MSTQSTPPPLVGDPRADAMANCLIFALNAFRNRPVYDPHKQTMEGWHTWFRRVLEEAGYKLADKPKE